MLLHLICITLVTFASSQSNYDLWKNPLNILSGKLLFTTFPHKQNENSTLEYNYSNIFVYNYGQTFSSPPQLVGGFINLAFNRLQTYKTIFLREYETANNSYCRYRAFTDKLQAMNVLYSLLIIDPAINGITLSDFHGRNDANVGNSIFFHANNTEIPILFTQGFIIDFTGYTSYTITPTFRRFNSSHCMLQVRNQSVAIRRFYYKYMLIQQSLLESQNIFTDYGWFNRSFTQGTASLYPSNLTSINTFYSTDRYIMSINSLKLSNNQFLNTTVLSNFTLSMQRLNPGDEYFNITYLNFRSLCVNPTPFYYQDNISCVANCSTGFLQNSSHPWVCRCYSQPQYYIVNETCKFCFTIFVGCIQCYNSSRCKTCNGTGHFINFEQRCICQDGYYLNGNFCLKCEVSCLTCVDRADYCLTCNQSNLRYFIQNRCDCVSIYSDCRNSTIPECNHSQCTYLSEAKLKIFSTIKDPIKNHLTVEMSISPVNEEFQAFNYFDLITFGLPNQTQIEYTYSNGSFNFSMDYFDDIQNYKGTLILNLTKVPLWYFKLAPVINYSYQISPNNNLASNFYPQQIYDQYQTFTLVVKVMICAGFLVYVVGLFSSRIASSQMIGTMQIAYLGLFIVNHADPLIESLDYLKHFNGYNTIAIYNEPNNSQRLSSIGFSSFVLNNFNISLAVFLVPLALSLIFYQIYLRSTKYKIRMQRMWKVTLGEGVTTAFLFTAYNFSSSLGAFFIYTTVNSWKFYVSLIEVLIYLGIMAIIFWLYITKSNTWVGQFKDLFNWNRFSQLYCLVPLSLRFLIGVTMGLGSMHYASGIVVLLFILADVVLVIKMKPFIQNYQNVRSVVHNSLSCLIIIVYIALGARGPSKSHGMFTYFPYLVVALVGINIVVGGILIINDFIQSKKKLQNKEEERKMEEREDSLRMDVFREAIKAINNTKLLAKKREI